jgi:hypothetical protein
MESWNLGIMGIAEISLSVRNSDSFPFKKQNSNIPFFQYSIWAIKEDKSNYIIN